MRYIPGEVTFCITPGVMQTLLSALTIFLFFSNHFSDSCLLRGKLFTNSLFDIVIADKLTKPASSMALIWMCGSYFDPFRMSYFCFLYFIFAGISSAFFILL